MTGRSDVDRFLRSWTLACVAGLFLGLVAQLTIGSIAPWLLPNKPAMAMLPLDVSLGLALGFMQYRALRHHIPQAWSWIPLTAIGALVAESLSGWILHQQLGVEFGFYRSDPMDALRALAVVGCSLGLCIGAVQLLCLYRYGPLALAWIPANMLAFTLAIATGDLIAVPEYFLFTAIGALVGFVLAGALYGVITGIVLWSYIGDQ